MNKTALQAPEAKVSCVLMILTTSLEPSSYDSMRSNVSSQDALGFQSWIKLCSTRQPIVHNQEQHIEDAHLMYLNDHTLLDIAAN